MPYRESRDERERLRADLTALGWTVDQIAQDIQRRFDDRPLSAYRHAHGISQPDVAERWNRLCPPSGEAIMSATRISAYERYPAPGTKRPTAGVLAVFAEIYQTAPRRLLTTSDYAGLPAQERLLVDRYTPVGGDQPAPGNGTREEHSHVSAQARERSLLLRSTDVTPSGMSAVPLDVSERVLIMAAAHESSSHAGRAETSNVGTTTLEQLDADLWRIANDYLTSPPLPLVVEMRRIRDGIYRLLEGRQRPADTARLYLAAGVLCGLLANASNDLGYRPQAAEQARAAWAYAEIIDHDALRAWVRGMQAMIEIWSDHPRQAVRLAQSGRRFADSATAKTRLATIEARAWGQLGNAIEAARCIHDAAAARDLTARDGLHDEVGGVFGFATAKSFYYAGDIYAHLGQAEPALHASKEALDLYTSSPEAHRSYGAESLARINAAAAHLIGANLDGATEALQPVFALDATRRTTSITDRLGQLRRRLAAQSLATSRAATALDESIEDFCVTSIVQLPY